MRICNNQRRALSSASTASSCRTSNAMDWPALILSLQLAAATVAILLPLGVALARILAWRRFAGRRVLEAALALPLVLPPTVLGFYLLVAFGAGSTLGGAFAALTGHPLAFSF